MPHTSLVAVVTVVAVFSVAQRAYGGTCHSPFTCGFLYSGGTYSTLNVPGSVVTEPFDINDNGVIVGQYYTNDFHSFLYSGGTYTTIDLPGTPWGINNHNEIVGTAGNNGFLYSGGSSSTISFPGSVVTSPLDVNDNGDVVGLYKNDLFGPYSGFEYNGRNYTMIHFPGSFDTETFGINDKDQIVGAYFNNSSYGQENEFMYSGGVYTTINLTGVPRRINDKGDILNWYFLYSDGSYKYLSFPGGSSTTNYGFNDQGEVVGLYSLPAITPLPPALVLFASSLAGIGLLGWCRTPKSSRTGKLPTIP